MQAMKSEIDRREFLRLAAAGLGTAAIVAPSTILPGETKEGPKAGASQDPVLRIEADPKRACVGVLSWDTEGGSKAKTNLLRENSPLALRIRVGGKWQVSSELPTQREDLGAVERPRYKSKPRELHAH